MRRNPNITDVQVEKTSMNLFKDNIIIGNRHFNPLTKREISTNKKRLLDLNYTKYQYPKSKSNFIKNQPKSKYDFMAEAYFKEGDRRQADNQRWDKIQEYLSLPQINNSLVESLNEERANKVIPIIENIQQSEFVEPSKFFKKMTQRLQDFKNGQSFVFNDQTPKQVFPIIENIQRPQFVKPPELNKITPIKSFDNSVLMPREEARQGFPSTSPTNSMDHTNPSIYGSRNPSISGSFDFGGSPEYTGQSSKTLTPQKPFTDHQSQLRKANDEVKRLGQKYGFRNILSLSKSEQNKIARDKPDLKTALSNYKRLYK